MQGSTAVHGASTRRAASVSGRGSAPAPAHDEADGGAGSHTDRGPHRELVRRRAHRDTHADSDRGPRSDDLLVHGVETTSTKMDPRWIWRSRSFDGMNQHMPFELQPTLTGDLIELRPLRAEIGRAHV